MVVHHRCNIFKFLLNTSEKKASKSQQVFSTAITATRGNISAIH